MLVLVCGVEEGERPLVVGLDEEGQSDEVVEQGLRGQHRAHFYSTGISGSVAEDRVGQHLVEVDDGVQLVVLEVDGEQVRRKDVDGGDVDCVVGLVGDQELERALDRVGEAVDRRGGRAVVEHAGAVGRVAGEHHLAQVFGYNDDRHEEERGLVQQPLRQEVDLLRLAPDLRVDVAALERHQQVHAQQEELLEELVAAAAAAAAPLCHRNGPVDQHEVQRRLLWPEVLHVLQVDDPQQKHRQLQRVVAADCCAQLVQQLLPGHCVSMCVCDFPGLLPFSLLAFSLLAFSLLPCSLLWGSSHAVFCSGASSWPLSPKR